MFCFLDPLTAMARACRTGQCTVDLTLKVQFQDIRRQFVVYTTATIVFLRQYPGGIDVDKQPGQSRDTVPLDPFSCYVLTPTFSACVFTVYCTV